MIPTKDEIAAILDVELTANDIGDVLNINEAAEAIAALLTPAHLMSEFVWQLNDAENYPQYIVTQSGGERYQVDTRPSGRLRCIPLYNKQRWCKNDEGCLHVQAVKLYLARQEAI